MIFATFYFLSAICSSYICYKFIKYEGYLDFSSLLLGVILTITPFLNSAFVLISTFSFFAWKGCEIVLWEKNHDN